jgi:GTP-binding protein
MLKVALVGRPNVGKSTLFNRLCGKKLALVDDQPGVTRDWREGNASIADLKFTIIDTAGLEMAGESDLENRIFAQTQQGISFADVILFIVDAREGLNPTDMALAQKVRRMGKPIYLLANKAENRSTLPNLDEMFKLGLGEPLAISSAHGEGVSDLYDILITHEAPQEEEKEEIPTLQIAIVGRPNAGKSTLVNTLLGYNRLLTGPQAGMTRDSISVDFTYDGKKIRLVDTAGQRRRARVDEKLEKLSVADALRAIQYAHIVILLMDATTILELQDLHIASHVIKEGRCLILGLNKWDQVTNKKATLEELEHRLKLTLHQAKGIPFVPLVALTGKGTDDLLKEAFKLYDLWNTRISTAKLNDWLKFTTESHPPPMVKGIRLKFKYATQIKTRPPTFAIFANSKDRMKESYLRYLENEMRKSFSLWGIPIRFVVKSSDNPYT